MRAKRCQCRFFLFGKVQRRFPGMQHSRVAVPERAVQKAGCERVLDLHADEPPQRPRAVPFVVAPLGKVIDHRVGHSERHSQRLEALGDGKQHTLGYAAHIRPAQAAEHYRIVDAV